MSMRPTERVSFVLSNIERDQCQRRPVQDVESRSAAAVAGSLGHFDGGTHVDASNEPPPKLQPRRTACSIMMVLWCLLSVIVVVGLVLQATLLHRGDEEESKLARRLARDPSVTTSASFGIWDSKGVITPLQLQVSVSVALGVRSEDEDVRVVAGEAHFFTISVQHATLEEVDFANTDVFLDRLNTQLENYGGVGVLSRQARLYKNESRV